MDYKYSKINGITVISPKLFRTLHNTLNMDRYQTNSLGQIFFDVIGGNYLNI